jgi:hypothetical protein
VFRAGQGLLVLSVANDPEPVRDACLLERVRQQLRWRTSW